MGEIVSIVSSPIVKGTSDLIVSKIVSGAIGMSTNMIYQYHTSELDARGCMLCMKCKSCGKCFQKDKITEMLEHIRTADCIIMSTPVLFDNVSGSFKIAMDRMYSLIDENGNSTIPKGKELIIVITYENDIGPAKDVESYIRHIMIDYFGCDHVGSLIVPRMQKCGEDRLDDDVTNAAYIYGSMLSISVPLDTYVESLDMSDPRRGQYELPHGFVWTGEELSGLIRNKTVRTNGE